MTITFALLVATATAGFDVDSVGLSALERSAVVERARTELHDVELVDAPGLAQCNADSSEASAPAPRDAHVDCARAALESAGAVAGAAVRVVKVLQVVRVELTILDRDGRAVTTSLRTLDVEGAAKGPLFDEAARASLATLAPRTIAPPSVVQTPALPNASPTMTYAAVGAGAAGIVLALVGGAFATNEALLANSPTSSGDEKERARILGPVATGAAVLGVVIAVGAPIALLSLDERERTNP